MRFSSRKTRLPVAIEIGDRQTKSAKDIDVAVVWSCTSPSYQGLYLRSLLIGDEGTSRNFYGATHQVYLDGQQSVAFEVIVLQDLIQYLTSPQDEEARHKSIYQ
jgi:hypothetical protein